MHECMYVCMNVCVCMYVCMYAPVYKCLGYEVLTEVNVLIVVLRLVTPCGSFCLLPPFQKMEAVCSGA
jgi:hypothetical protein